MLALGRDFDVDERFRAALLISSAFDPSIEQALLPLMGGGAAVVVSDAVRESPVAFWQQVKRDGITFVSCVPSFFESVLARRSARTPALDHLALGGEAFTGEFRSEIARHVARSRASPISTARPRPRSTRCRIASPAIEAARSFRSAIRWRIIGSTSWMPGWSRFRPAWSASSTSPGLGLARGYLRRAATHGGAVRRRPARRRRAAGCTAPATWRGGGPTACWSSWGAPTRR